MLGLDLAYMFYVSLYVIWLAYVVVIKLELAYVIIHLCYDYMIRLCD
jgi:hypothetical protein